MASDVFFKPSVVLTSADRVTLHLGRRLNIFISKEMIVVGIEIFSERNARALAAPDLTVFDHPAFRPVRAYHTVLKSCRRSPVGGCLVDVKAVNPDIVNSGLRREEYIFTNVDLHVFLCRISTPEISVDNGLIGFLVLNGIPLKSGRFGLPAAFVNFGFDSVFQ